MKLTYALLPLLSLFINTEVHASHQWTQRANFGASGRHRAVGISIGNRAYVGLGHYNGAGVEAYLADWWEFDPATGAWTQKVDYPGNNGNGELGAHGIGLESVGYIGLGELDDYSLYKYNPVTNSWIQVSSPPATGTFQDSGDFTIGHKSYFTRVTSAQLWEYNADTDSWTQKNLPPFNVSFSFAGFSINGKGYLKTSDSWLTLNDFWEYDPTLDSWTLKAVFPGLARLSSISFVQSGKGYIISGYGESGYSDLNSEVWQYTPTTDSWLQLEDFPGLKRRYSMGLSIGERCYLGTGTNGTNFNDFWEFSAVAGANELSAQFTFEVYPNPVVDFFNITSKEMTTFKVELYNAQAKRVASKKTTAGFVKLDRNSLRSGIYFYRIVRDGEIIASDRVILR